MTEFGKYGVFEGQDGTGKTTIAREASLYLQQFGYDPLLVYDDETHDMQPVSEPGGTEEANVIRRRIKDKSIPRTPWQNVEWFTEARMLIWRDAILPALEAGRPVLTARSWVSSVVYQGYGEGVPVEDIRQYTAERMDGLYISPDLLCILAIKNDSVLRERLKGRGTETHLDTFESMPPAMQQRFSDGYIRFAQENDVPLMEADGTRSQVMSRVMPLVVKLFPGVPDWKEAA